VKIRLAVTTIAILGVIALIAQQTPELIRYLKSEAM
jgi:hypothetical protein